MSDGSVVWLRMCSAPDDGGYTPEISVVRAGAHTGAVDHAFR